PDRLLCHLHLRYHNRCVELTHLPDAFPALLYIKLREGQCLTHVGREGRALGVVVEETQLVSRERAIDLLRRFFWALNDESGAVPYGTPEAIGEILAVRPELQADFLPILCSLLTDEDMPQTGSIERGVLWALGRVGSPVARYSPEAVEAPRQAAKRHLHPETREIAARSLAPIVASG
ncbi:MAG: DVU0298 family protein, partial [Candidatus Methylomirabilales bacterium]